MDRTLVGLATLLFAGCLLPSQEHLTHPKYSAPVFEDYVAYIQANTTEPALPTWEIPKIPTSLQIAEPFKLENPFRMSLWLASVDAKRICFLRAVVGAKLHAKAEDLAQDMLDGVNQDGFAIRALTSLASERGRPLHPVPADATRLDAFEMVSDEIKDFDNDGTVGRRRVVEFRLCGPSPSLTKDTKFIALTVHHASADKPKYASLYDAKEGPERQRVELDNQGERLKADGLILIAITDGEPDLSMK